MNKSAENSGRLTVVDALRGFALFGILQVHSIEHYDLYFFPEASSEFLKSLNTGVWDTLFFLFGGKAFAMFAMMFGLSFYILMESRRNKNEDFRLRFLWRLCLLLVIGFFHGLIYEGDVLRFLALFGPLLLLFDRLSDKVLWPLSFLFLMNIPWIVQLLLSFTPGFEPIKTPMNELYGQLGEIESHGTFWEVVKANFSTGFLANASFHWESGRYTQIPGLFIWGLLLGRNKFFQHLDQKKKVLLKIIGVSAGLFAIFFIVLKVVLPLLALPEISLGLAQTLATNYSNISFMVLLASVFVWLCTLGKDNKLAKLFSPYGRMSLSNYISMGLFNIPIYYGYGLGMYQYMGAAQCLLAGLSFFVLQLWFSHYWMRNFYYGPMEWLWRCLTLGSFQTPLRKK